MNLFQKHYHCVRTWREKLAGRRVDGRVMSTNVSERWFQYWRVSTNIILLFWLRAGDGWRFVMFAGWLVRVISNSLLTLLLTFDRVLSSGNVQSHLDHCQTFIKARANGCCECHALIQWQEWYLARSSYYAMYCGGVNGLPLGRMAIGQVRRANGQLCRLFMNLFIVLILPMQQKCVARSMLHLVMMILSSDPAITQCNNYIAPSQIWSSVSQIVDSSSCLAKIIQPQQAITTAVIESSVFQHFALHRNGGRGGTVVKAITKMQFVFDENIRLWGSERATMVSVILADAGQNASTAPCFADNWEQ